MTPQRSILLRVTEERRSRRTVGRPVAGELFPALPTSFSSVAAPRPLRGEDRAEYAAKWRALIGACETLGWDPVRLAASGVAALNEARKEAGLVAWSPYTVAYYAKLVRYSGLAFDHHPVSEFEQTIDARSARLLWVPAASWTVAAAWRSAALARLAWAWPAPVQVWLALPTDAVRLAGADQVRIDPPQELEVPGAFVPYAASSWAAWLDARAHLGVADSPWAMCATNTGPAGAQVGGALSLRALQAAFAKHARHCGLGELSYDRYRLSAVRDGAPVIGERGAVRAARASGK